MTGPRTPDQRETSIFGSNLELGFLMVETCDQPWATKIDKLLARHPDAIHDFGGYSDRYPFYRRVLMPRELLGIKSPRGVEAVEDTPSVDEWLSGCDATPARSGGPWRGIELRTEILWSAADDTFRVQTNQEWMIGLLVRQAARFPDHFPLHVARNAWGQWLVSAEWPLDRLTLRPLRRELNPPPTFDRYGNAVKADRYPSEVVGDDESAVSPDHKTVTEDDDEDTEGQR